MKVQLKGVVTASHDKFDGRVLSRHLRIPTMESKIFMRKIVTITHWIREHIDKAAYEGKEATITLEIDEATDDGEDE